MRNTEELENMILSCLLLNPGLLGEYDLDEKYFATTNKILEHFKKFYKTYKNLDTKRLYEKASNKKATIEKIQELTLCEVTWKNIYGYYKELKEIWTKNETTRLTEMLNEGIIDLKTFNSKIFKLSKTDFEEEEIIKFDEIGIEKRVEREYTNINELDYLLKGIEYGKLSLWSGITNHGKTTLMIQFAKECIKAGKKIFYFSGEQTATEFKNYLYIGMCNKEQLEFVADNKNSKIYDTKPKDEMIEYFDNIYGKQIYLYNNNNPENNITTMMKVMKKAFNDGVRIFFIDNFMQLDNSEKLEEQTIIVENFKRFARDNNVIINLVAHPRKTQFQLNRLTIFDISGTQNIANKSSNICTIMRTDILPEKEKQEIERQLWKNNYDIKECDAIIEILKTKGNACKMIGLYYDRENKTYSEAQKKQDYEKPETRRKRRDDEE